MILWQSMSMKFNYPEGCHVCEKALEQSVNPNLKSSKLRLHNDTKLSIVQFSQEKRELIFSLLATLPSACFEEGRNNAFLLDRVKVECCNRFPIKDNNELSDSRSQIIHYKVTATWMHLFKGTLKSLTVFSIRHPDKEDNQINKLLQRIFDREVEPYIGIPLESKPRVKKQNFDVITLDNRGPEFKLFWDAIGKGVAEDLKKRLEDNLQNEQLLDLIWGDSGYSGTEGTVVFFLDATRNGQRKALCIASRDRQLFFRTKTEEEKKELISGICDEFFKGYKSLNE